MFTNCQNTVLALTIDNYSRSTKHAKQENQSALRKRGNN